MRDYDDDYEEAELRAEAKYARFKMAQRMKHPGDPDYIELPEDEEDEEE